MGRNLAVEDVISRGLLVEDTISKGFSVQDVVSKNLLVDSFTEDAVAPRELRLGMPMGLLLTITYPETINL